MFRLTYAGSVVDKSHADIHKCRLRPNDEHHTKTDDKLISEGIDIFI